MRTKEEHIQDYNEKELLLLERCWFPCSPYDFYRDIFPEDFLQEKGRRHYKDGKFTAIINEVRIRKDGGRYRVNHYLTDELSLVPKMKGKEAFVAPCSYVGGSKTNENLRYIHAFVVDLDYVGIPQLKDFFYQVQNGLIPRPTYIVNSGTGMHLYYVLEQPVKVWPEQIKGYKLLKDALIRQAMNQYTSRAADKRQYEGIGQPYRVIGSITKLDYDENKNPSTNKYPVTAYPFPHGRKWTVEELLTFKPDLGHYVEDMAKAAEALGKKSRTPIDQAKEQWPDWYERRILHQEPPKSGKWHVNPRVYHWWIRQIKSGAYDGNRYFCIFCLATYAIKCDIPLTQLRQDAYSLLPYLDGLTESETNHFTAEDIEAALSAYTDDYKTYPIHAIEHHTKIHIEPNKRNGQKREWHLEDIRDKKKKMKERGQAFKNPEGRPKGSKNKYLPKKEAVLAYFEQHPEASNSQASRDLKISRPTIIKYRKKNSG